VLLAHRLVNLLQPISDDILPAPGGTGAALPLGLLGLEFDSAGCETWAGIIAEEVTTVHEAVAALQAWYDLLAEDEDALPAPVLLFWQQLLQEHCPPVHQPALGLLVAAWNRDIPADERD
jgi:hypothetical protein